jgi:hypothetical protein
LRSNNLRCRRPARRPVLQPIDIGKHDFSGLKVIKTGVNVNGDMSSSMMRVAFVCHTLMEGSEFGDVKDNGLLTEKFWKGMHGVDQVS